MADEGSEAARLLRACWRGGRGRRKHLAPGSFFTARLYRDAGERYPAPRWSQRPAAATLILSKAFSTDGHRAPSRPTRGNRPSDYRHGS